MALFIIQLVRVVITSVVELQAAPPNDLLFDLDYVISIHQMLNVIIRSVHFLLLFVLLMTFTGLRALHQQ